MWYVLSIAILNLGIGFALAVAIRSQRAAPTAIVEAARHVDRYQQQLVAVGDQLRRASRSPEDVSACVAQLGAAHRDFLAGREQIDGVLHAADDAAQVEQARTRLAQLWQQQCDEVARAEQSTRAFQPAGDLEQQCRDMAQQNAELFENNHRLRDALDEAMADLARAESWTARGAADQAGASNGEPGLESFWAEWWSGGPDQIRQLSVAAVDVDELGKLNSRCGSKASDRVLQDVAQLLAAECGPESRVSRASGGTFLVLLPGTDLRAATTLIERARQRLERTRFLAGGETVEVTVSCGLTESGQADASQSLMERVEATLAEAKRYGRNRTFVHEGNFPTPVVPPNFEIEQREIEL